MFSGLRRTLVDSLAPMCTGKVMTLGTAVRKPLGDVGTLVDEHFGMSTPQCRKTITRSLQELNQRPAIIIETGSSAWGVNSSMLFDSYVNSFGGHFATVDKRLVPLATLKGKVTKRTTLYCDDSLNFHEMTVKAKDAVDLVYLDSWDVNWSYPLASGYHGLREMLAVLPILRKSNGILLVDDTPANPDIFHKETGLDKSVFESFVNTYGSLPGKGGLILNYLQGNNIGSVIQHDYQLLVKF